MMIKMPGGRKGNIKVDGAFQDVTLKPIPGSEEFGGYKAQEEQISAVGGPTPGLQEAVAATGGMPGYKPEDIFAKPKERIDESGLADTQKQEIVDLPNDINLDIIKEIIQNNYGYRIKRRFK